MQNHQTCHELAGQILVAMPTMLDPRFAKTVIMICIHDQGGTMGLILNKKSSRVNSKALFDDLEIKVSKMTPDFPIYIGGPVSPNSGFVLHSEDYRTDTSSITITSELSVTSTHKILADVAQGRGPREFMLALGYAGWQPGQLERELQNNGWLLSRHQPDLIFSPASTEEKWNIALKKNDISPGALSSFHGHA